MSQPYTLTGSGAGSESRSELGQPMLRTSTTHNVIVYRNQRFWAQGGRVHIVDEVSGDYKSCTWRDFVGRISAVNKGYHKLPWADERAEARKLVDNGIAVAQAAKSQGDPTERAMASSQNPGRKARLVTGGVGMSYPNIFPTYAGAGTVRTGMISTRKPSDN